MAGARGVFAVMLLVALPAWAEEPSKEDLEFFEKKIRPLLVESCHECHGADKQKANLRLDSREAVLKGGDSGPAVDPGNPDESLLIEAVNYLGDTQMPPKGKLEDEKINDLKEWIQRGAPWPKEKPKGATPSRDEFDLAARKASQWALQPVRVAEPPMVADPAWSTTAVDRFLKAKLDEAGLKPASPADRRALLRRVTYDLVGLPPNIDEIQAFLADDSPKAFDKVVDRLLASPHYGERWARHWLDLVRYAETRGHEFDFEIPHAFEYRDYVIRAFNADVPYDQFVMEHLAGDLLPQPRRDPRTGINESLIGTGFWFLGEAKHSPVDVLGDEADRIDNQIDVFGKAFLACTLGCARCHDHKFDAISHKDYYALAGYLQSSRYQVASIDPPQERQEIARGLQKLLTKKFAAQIAARQRVVESDHLDKLPVAGLYGLLPEDAALDTFTRREKLDGGAVKAWVGRFKQAREDAADPLHAWTRLANIDANPEQVTAAQLQGWRTAALKSPPPEQGVVFEDFNGTDWGTWIPSGEAFGPGPLPPPWTTLEPSLRDLGPVPSGGLAHSGALSTKLQGALRSPTFTIAHPRIAYRMTGANVRVRLVLHNLQLIQNPIYGGLEIKLQEAGPLKWFVQSVDKWIGHKAYIEVLDEGDGYAVLDRVAFVNDASPELLPSAQSEALLGDGTAQSIVELARQLKAALAKSSDLQAAVIPQALVDVDTGELDDSAAELAAKVRYGRKAVAMVDGNGRDEDLFLRGNPRKHGDPVPRRFLEALAGDQPAPKSGSGRLELAQRLVEPANPLTARVIVNRVWNHHFGEGIVRTPDDFGNMGQPPSHPELLDFLAAEFQRDGWSLKRLHRRLLLTRAYQMSSDPADAVSEERDPQNRLWHRMPLKRLEAEAIRDAMLAVSGRLDPTQYGPSVLPHLTPFMIGRGRPGQTGPLDGNGRRSVYINVRRNFLTPLFLAFDAPIPFSTIGRRSVSNVPAQALALMNNPFVVEQAELWAKKTADIGDPDERIRVMYETAFTRGPTDTEFQAAQAFLAEQAQAHPEVADRAWADLAHVLFNVKEFIFIR